MSLNIEKSEEKSDKQNYSYEPVDNSPFKIVKDEKGYFAVMGKYRISEVYEKKEDVEKNLVLNWSNIINLMLIVKMIKDE